ncbi:MAG TPA: SWIM zinc finger family protein [Chroococcales cyanobacterium]
MSYDYYNYSSPIAVSGGIKAHSKRGPFGSTWWGRRWMESLESLNGSGRLTRGRSYARGGQVISLEIGPGHILARVQGSRRTPYQVEILVEKWSKEDGLRLAKSLSPLSLAAMLAGEMPADIENEAAKIGLSLFPKRRKDLKLDCSCPDWGDPCKHAAAVCCLVAEAFDHDPFLLLRLHGVEREMLVGAISQIEETPEETGIPLGSGEVFWKGAALPPGFWGEAGELAPAAKVAPILDRLGAFPFWRGEDFYDSLRPIYEEASRRGLAALTPSPLVSQGEEGEN